MIKINETRISRFTPTKIGLNITLEIKDEDLTEDLEKVLKEFWKNWNSLVVWIQEYWQEYEDKKKPDTAATLTWNLHFLMMKYCEKEWIDLTMYNDQFKKRYSVEHKSQIDIEDIKREIESHKAWLNYL